MKHYNFRFKKKFYILRGFTLIDVLVGSVLILIVFLGIFGAYQLGLKVVGLSKARIDATALANQQIEIIRNLPYESVGTEGAELPYVNGILDSSTSTVRNNIEYTVETQVKYIIDEADGIGEVDECNWDYKRVEVKISWPGRFGGEVKLITDVAPKNKIEEINTCIAQPGGILLVSVFNAYGEMINSPFIEILNPETGETITSYSPPTGKHDFPLGPSIYKVVISKTSYSSERTYGIDEIATPEKPHPLVLEGQLTENSFSIDVVSSFSVETLSPWGLDYFSDSFLNESKISELFDVVIADGEVKLATDDAGYKDSGFLISVPITPTNLISWEDFSFNDFEEAETQILYYVLYFDGENWVLIPETDLSGNSTGFTVSPVDLSGLNINSYPQLKVKGNFSTTDPGKSPVLYNWQISWKNSEATPITNVTFHLQGAKLIGKDGDEQSVYKYSQNHTSGGEGQINIPNLEWDSYVFSLDPATGLDLENIEPSPQPISLDPETSLVVELYLESQNSLLVSVQNIETEEPIFSANVRLYNDSGFDVIQYTDEKGGTYFIPLEADTYTIEVQAPGYSDYSGSVSVSGDETKIINLQQVE